jgi:hypothetical protein
MRDPCLNTEEVRVKGENPQVTVSYPPDPTDAAILLSVAQSSRRTQRSQIGEVRREQFLTKQHPRRLAIARGRSPW